MWKKILAGSAAVAIVGSSLALAQQRLGGADGPRFLSRWQPTAEDAGAFTDARIAGLRAGLRLTEEQQKNWPAFEGAYRAIAKLRAERMTAPGERPRADERMDQERAGNVIERLQQRADALSRRATALKQLADAAAPLYQSLDEGQKRRFLMLARLLQPRHSFAAWHAHRGFGPGGFQDRGFGSRMGDGGTDDRRFEDRGIDGRRFGDGHFGDRNRGERGSD